MLFYTVLVLSYTLNGDYLQAKVIFPSARACGDALPDYHDHVYAIDRDAIGQCLKTEVISSSIKPKRKP
jgi:hypothetical protein